MSMNKFSFLTSLAYLLSIVGAVNWGLIAVFNFNLVEFLFNNYPTYIKAVYVAVGLSGVFSLFTIFGMFCCKKEGS